MSALHLIESNPRRLLPAGHALINGAIRDLLDRGLVRYAPERAIGYALTATGRGCL